MAEGNNGDLPFLQYLVPETIPGLPTRGRPCPSPAGDVSFFNGSPPTITHDNRSQSFESLAILPFTPDEATTRTDKRYGSINNEPEVVNRPTPSNRPRLWCKVVKMMSFIVLLTTFLFYAIGHGYKIYMQYDLSQLENFVVLYKFYIITSYIGVIVVGFVSGFCLHSIVQNLHEAPIVSRSLSRSLEIVYM